MIIFAILSFCRCKNDVFSGSKEAKIVRFDKLLFELDTAHIKSSFDSLHNQYPYFTDIYFENVVPVAGYKSDSVLFYKELKSFIKDTAIMRLENIVEEVFGDMTDIEMEFDKAFSNLSKEFPQEKLPYLYSYVSGFQIQRFIFQDRKRDGLAFGADLFLGNNFPYNRMEHGQNTFSNYLVRTYNKQHLVKKVMELWVDDKIGDSSGNRAIDEMIKNGKKLYIIKRLLPGIADTVLLEYTSSQIDWLHKNEREMWTFFIENNLFYTTDSYKIKRLTSPAPNSQALGMPKKSPGATGNYLGYKIVSAFMKRNGEMSLEKLINYKNSQKLMEKSGFKPRLD